MADGNPFDGSVQSHAAGSGGYPFDLSAPQGPVAGQPNPFVAQQPSNASPFMPATSQPPAADNPFGSPVSPPPAPMTVQPYVAPGYPGVSPPADPHGQAQAPPYPPPQPQQAAAFSPSGYAMSSPMSAAPATPATNPYQGDALVVSQYQSNPYSGFITPQQTVQPSPGGGTVVAKAFDPFAPPPPPAPAPGFPTPESLAPPVPQYGQMEVYNQPQQDPFGVSPPLAPSNPDDEDPLAAFGGTPKAPEPKPQPPSSQVATRERSDSGRQYGPPPDQPVDLPSHTAPPSYDYGQRSADSSNPAPNEPTLNPNLRNPYREELARRAPPGSSPLPKADLVRKRGYVLARISFRTIVMKKWKQTYWVQYGPHTMLWFRSESDFTDWLNNPYHDQTQRNFLIKLAVNFVHDLYKPNVRGYQVTQCRTKAYGNKMIRQFKLERWMDYGPTIAAAFGSYNPREVDDLREALVECMRNTPLNSGIRATGAVRQRPHQEGDDPDHHHRRRDDRSYDDDEDGRRSYDDGDRRYDDRHGAERQQRSPDQQNGAAPTSGDSVAEESDLLDVDNWDDVPASTSVALHQQPLQQPAGQYSASPQSAYGDNPYAPYSSPPVAQQPYPPQQAIIPVAAPQAYPGAPPLPQQGMMPGQPMPPQQPGYPAAAAQDPWGAPQPQVQPTSPPAPYAPYPAQQPYASPQLPYPPQPQYPSYQHPTGY